MPEQRRQVVDRKTMATWLTGLFVAARTARSASFRPVNDHTSPLAAIDAASASVTRVGAIGIR